MASREVYSIRVWKMPGPPIGIQTSNRKFKKLIRVLMRGGISIPLLSHS
jgi:hypothetical protein